MSCNLTDAEWKLMHRLWEQSPQTITQLTAALSAETGRLIRKYETYRAVQRETGAVSEILPRILLMIDEYQSLFEGNTETAALLSELVRKGRTYGVHLIMASQRGVSESARNTFTAELKDHFSTRLVFRCPPAAARRLFSDRAVDTGRENTGIDALEPPAWRLPCC